MDIRLERGAIDHTNWSDQKTEVKKSFVSSDATCVSEPNVQTIYSAFC